MVSYGRHRSRQTTSNKERMFYFYLYTCIPLLCGFRHIILGGPKTGPQTHEHNFVNS